MEDFQKCCTLWSIGELNKPSIIEIVKTVTYYTFNGKVLTWQTKNQEINQCNLLTAYSMDVVKIIILRVVASEYNMNVNSIFKMIAEHCYHITSDTTAYYRHVLFDSLSV